MFRKKKRESKPLFPIAYIHLFLNVNEIQAWINTENEIGLDSRWTNQYGVKCHTIYWFLDNGLHYHRSCNQFSHTLSGLCQLNDDIGSVEWYVRHEYFCVYLPDCQKIIFRCPIEEIARLSITGKIGSEHRTDADGAIIDLDKTGDPDVDCCAKINLTNFSDFSMSYGNELVLLDFSVPSASHVTYYDE